MGAQKRLRLAVGKDSLDADAGRGPLRKQVRACAAATSLPQTADMLACTIMPVSVTVSVPLSVRTSPRLRASMSVSTF